ncbi:MAG: hypothetical protein RIE06_12455 [Roseibium album]|uniref:hypothetical protein n=1 Tax=Roseibium album TaxID=311410 RepID=UPI0032EE3D8A
MLAEFSTGKGYVFSRYGDDIVISGSDIQENEFFEAISIVHTNGYSINQSKTRLARKSKRTIITGISISNGSLKLPKEKKRKIRQQVYFIRKNGVLAESFSDDVFDPFYADRVLGKIVFWHNVEPENTFAKKAFNDLKALMNEHKTKYF